MKKTIDILISAALGIISGCTPAPLRDVPPSGSGTIIGWRLVNRPYRELEKLQLAGDAQVPGKASALVYEPLYKGDETGCDPSEFVRLEIVGSKRAHVGELVTARISIPNADEDARHVVDIRATNEWTRIEGPSRIIVEGPEVKTVRFTTSVVGRVGIRVSALRADPQGD